MPSNAKLLKIRLGFGAFVLLLAPTALSHAAMAQETAPQEPAPQATGAPTLQLKPTIFKPRPVPTIERDPQAEGETYTLEYKLAAGLTYPSKVTQKLSVQTTISGVKEDSVTNSVSGKSWRIEAVDVDRNIKLHHQVESVAMSQRTTGRQEVKYDSQIDEAIPSEYQSLEGTIGVPLTKVEMNRFGRIIAREDLKPQSNPGIGDLTLSLPEEPVHVGDAWNVADEVTVKLDNVSNVIKLRYAYSLLSVRAGLATISFRTQVITPIGANPRVMSQLVGRIQKGEIKFDIDEGRPISRTATIEEDIVGFAGENSSMRYDMQASEEYFDGVAVVAALPEAAPKLGPESPLATPITPKAPKLLPGISTSGKEAEQGTPTPATPPPAQGTPTPADPPAKVTLAPKANLPTVENSVLVAHKSDLLDQ